MFNSRNKYIRSNFNFKIGLVNLYTPPPITISIPENISNNINNSTNNIIIRKFSSFSVRKKIYHHNNNPFSVGKKGQEQEQGQDKEIKDDKQNDNIENTNDSNINQANNSNTNGNVSSPGTNILNIINELSLYSSPTEDDGGNGKGKKEAFLPIIDGSNSGRATNNPHDINSHNNDNGIITGNLNTGGLKDSEGVGYDANSVQSTAPTATEAVISPPIDTDSVQDLISVEKFIDTFQIYQQLEKSGFNEIQSEIILNLILESLKNKIKWLEYKYSPNVDLENESYLFEAAHSEILVEITHLRENSISELTNSYIYLRRLFNSLEDLSKNQNKFNSDLIKIEVKNFQHENNLHQKKLDIKNHDLNNKIISELMSGLKTDIESFRWHMTRSGIMAILLMAIAILGGWNISKSIKFNVNEDLIDNLLPILPQIHEPSEEDSHEYEADWDDEVKPLNQYLVKKLPSNNT
ncbi:hypothetical protein B5S33_g4869 [[Candida] boidinii]|nr:hypothetical protein B5S30_g5170 [[Candida] boidinii]OWB86187.1 hypothetical protein B5S33_g4869 [[Candida] boidinii]GMG04020.1 unnamed protein product [[Candida] boidinii]